MERHAPRYGGFLVMLLVAAFILAGAPLHAQKAVFIPNMGQWDAGATHRAQVPGGSLFLTPTGMRFAFLGAPPKQKAWAHGHAMDGDTLWGHNVWLTWPEANNTEKPDYKQEKPSKEYYNFFTPATRDGRATGLRAYKKLTRYALYPGIDVVWGMDTAAGLEYCYLVAPGADAGRIRMKIEGADKVSIARDGSLNIDHSLGRLTEEKPTSWYFDENGRRHEVKTEFHLIGDNEVRFRIKGKAWKKHTLYLDPNMVFATYSGSLSDNFGFTGTYDSAGHGYSGGTVYGARFPVTPGAFQTVYGGGRFVNGSIGDVARDAGILKYSPDGSQLIWATYLGGSGNDQPHSMVVDHKDNLWIMGTTTSDDFPLPLSGGYDTSFNGKSDIYVVKLSSAGDKMIAGTYLGGSDYDGLNGVILTGVRNPSPLGHNYGDPYRGEIIVDDDGNPYVASTTFSSDFPVSAGAMQSAYGTGQDAVVFKLDSAANNLIFSTYMGSGGADAAYGLVLDAARNVYVTGGTQGGNWMTDKKTYQPNYRGDPADGFLVHIKADGSQMINGTFIGTDSYDQSHFVEMDLQRNVYIYGQTLSDKWLVRNAGYFNPKGKQFIMKFNSTLDTVEFSTTFGSGRRAADLSPSAFLVDDCGKIYVSGWGGGVNVYPLGNGGSTRGMPVTADAYQSTTDSSDFWIGVFSRNADTLLYASFFGGLKSQEHVDGGTSRFDKKGVIYQSVCGGCGGNSDFPTTPGAWSRTNRSNNCNNLLFKVDLNIVDVTAGFEATPLGCAPLTVNIKDKSLRAQTYLYDFGDGTKSTAAEPTHTYTKGGTYTITQVVSNRHSCQESDTLRRQVKVYTKADASFNVKADTCDQLFTFQSTGEGTAFHWDFGDGQTSAGASVTHVYDRPGTYTARLTADPGSPCEDTVSKTIVVRRTVAQFGATVDTCTRKITLRSTGTAESKRLWKINGMPADTAAEISITADTTTCFQVSLIAYDIKGCVDSVAREVCTGERPFSDFDLQVDNCARRVTLINKSKGSGGYAWDFGDGANSTARNATHTYLPGKDTFTIRLTAGTATACPNIYGITFRFEKRPDIQLSYTTDTCTGETRLEALGETGDNYSWHFGDGAIKENSKIVTHRYREDGKIVARFVNASPRTGCVDTFEIAMNIKTGRNDNIRLPNVFTPNDDGFNDVYEAGGLTGCQTYIFEVFNRWGQRVYYYKGNKIAWDGKDISGKFYPDGVYYYLLTFEIDGHTQTGSISLIK